jgi:phosphoribosyl 1,2-cyclic phosphodiesterase
MKVSALSSGSSGNCFYIENEKRNRSILVDCGISCKQVEERLAHIKKDPNKIKAVFVTHEHTDHIKGIDVFARKFNVPIFAPKKIAQNHFLCSDSSLINEIKNDETIKFGKMHITAFPKSHKSLDPVSYNLLENRKKLSVITDAGYACPNVIENVSDSNFLCIESNYDEKMLMEGMYPWPTKQWIKGDTGHLSNMQSAACVLEHGTRKLKDIMLCHLSQNNNTPEKALETYSYFMKQRHDIKPEINISLRDSATQLFRV